MNPRRTNQFLLRTLIGAAGIAWSASGAHAQNALGDGRALDANTGPSGRINYERPSFSQELQFRNAIVTGNAPGGLSFRGDLGYRAAGEFSGDIGADDLFSFRRDSLYSGLAGMGIRGTDALQYQFSLTTGARPPQNLTGNFNYGRETQYQTANAVTNTMTTTVVGRNPLDTDARGLGLYQASAQESELSDAITGTLRSSSAYTTTTSLSPVILSTFEQGLERRQFGLTASVLTGVTTVPMRSPQDRNARPEPDTRANPTGVPRDPTQPRTPTAYEQVLDRMRTKAGEQAARNSQTTTQTTTPSTMPGQTPPGQTTTTNDQMADIAKRLEALRNGMMGANAPGDAARPPAGQTPTPGANQVPGQTPGQSQTPDQTQAPVRPGAAPAGANPTTPGAANPGGARTGGANPAAAALQAEYDPARYTVDPATLELIRTGDAPLTAFIDPNAEGRDLYSEHMRAGERLIAAERYFDAEERFARALTLKPGDPTAQVGRAHAQLGAGLSLSAAVNLRSLFVLNPEMMGARYAGRLLPSPERIDLLIENLRERAGLVKVPGRPPEERSTQISSAILLAYLGYQNGRPEVVREGFSVVRESGSPEDVRLVTILAQVWLPESNDGPGATQDAP